MDDLPDGLRAIMQQFFANVESAKADWPKPLEIVRKTFPVDMQPEHQADALHYALREHGDYVATGGRDWHEDRRRGLRAFYAMLREDNLVVVYGPDRGWGVQQRLRQDDDLIVRIENPTQEQQLIWRFLSEELAP